LVPDLARSTGLGPVFFPSQGSLGDHAVAAEPIPVQAYQAVIALKTFPPELQKDARLLPLLKAVVGHGMLCAFDEPHLQFDGWQREDASV
jgi:hypothetical protein